ncbi:MAG: hypothetical protein WC627_11305 [Legionella sp.]|jgi:hypothetical protein
MSSNPMTTIDAKSAPKLATVENWAQLMFEKEYPLKEGITHIGLHNPIQFIAFLKSPMGKSLQAAITKSIAQHRANIERIQQANQEAIAEKQLLRRLIYLSALAAREARAEQVKEETEMLQQQQLDELNKVTQPVADANAAAARDSIAALNQAVAQAQNELNLNLDDLEHNLSEFEDLNRYIDFEAKYNLYDKAMDEFDESILSKIMKGDTLDTAAVAKEQSLLKEDAEKLSDEITNLLEAGKDEEAQKLLAKLNAVMLQAASVETLAAVTPNTAYFKFDETGDNLVGASAKDADFILNSSQQKIVVENGICYLLDANEDLSDENKEAAKNNFDRNKNSMMPIRALIQDNKKAEKNLFTHLGDLNDIQGRVNQNREKNAELCNKITQNTTTIVDASTKSLALQKAPRPGMSPKPVMTPIGTTATSMYTAKDIEELRPILPVIQQYSHQKGGMPISVYNRITKDKNITAKLNNSLGIDINKPPSTISPEQLKVFIRNMTSLGLDPKRNFDPIPGFAKRNNPNNLVSERLEEQNRARVEPAAKDKPQPKTSAAPQNEPQESTQPETAEDNLYHAPKPRPTPYD